MAHRFSGKPIEISETIVVSLNEVTLIRRALNASGEKYENPHLYDFFDKLEDEMIDNKRGQES